MSTLRKTLEKLATEWANMDCRVDLPENAQWGEGCAQGYSNAAADLLRLLAAHSTEPAPAFVSPEQAKRLAWYASMDDASAEPVASVTRSVEIPDAAVKDAFRAIQDHWHAPLPLTYADVTAALVAARPYLMPTREAVHAAIADELDGEGVVSYGLAPKLTARVMDLLNGAES